MLVYTQTQCLYFTIFCFNNFVQAKKYFFFGEDYLHRRTLIVKIYHFLKATFEDVLTEEQIQGGYVLRITLKGPE